MQLTQRYRYAVLHHALYRFRQAKWKAYLLDVAKYGCADMDKYAEAISYHIEDISMISSFNAQELLNKEDQAVDIKEIGSLEKK